MLNILDWLCAWTIMAWYVSAWTIIGVRSQGKTPPSVVRHIYHEIRPFFIPLVAASHWLLPSLQGEHHWWYAILFALHCYTWWSWRNLDDDDRWQRRTRKTTEAVTRTGARLTVQPAGADA